jgi:hypothetical protein
MTNIQQFRLPCDCEKCKAWDGVSDIICEAIVCICEKAVILKCETLPYYTCVDSYCAFHIGADNEYFKKYIHTMDTCRDFFSNHVNTRTACLCGVLVKASMARATCSDVHIDNEHHYTNHYHEIQLFLTCRNGTCNYERSVIQLQDSRIRCVCGRFCLHDGEIYKCSRGEAGCGTYFHELDSLTYMHTTMLQEELEEHVFAYLPKNVKQLKCGHYGILKYRENNCENKCGKLILICRSLFCDEFTEAIIAPDFKIEE